MAKIVYLRTDKNGIKYYANYTCPRCGGAGGSDKWAFTGWTCYECGGTGESSTPVIEKEYTPEYRAKLDERARKRAEAKRAKQVEEFNNNRLAIAEKYGFNPEGKIYVVTGNTYEIREELREAGAKYRGGINWYFLEKQDRYPTIELSYEECLNIYPEYGTMSWKDLTEVQAVLNSKIPIEEDHSQYVGQVGDTELAEVYSVEIPVITAWVRDDNYVHSTKEIFLGEPSLEGFLHQFRHHLQNKAREPQYKYLLVENDPKADYRIPYKDCVYRMYGEDDARAWARMVIELAS